MNKTTRTILIVLGVIFMCCCIVVAGGYLFFGQIVRMVSSGDMFVEDPAEISQVADDIADYDLPSGYEEEFVMNFLGIRSLFITNQSQGGMIMMVQFNESFFGGLENAQEQFQDSFMQQYNTQDITFNFVEERTVEINGEMTSVQVFQGSDSEGFDYIQWVTVFDGDNGTVMVMIMGSESTWNDAEMESFLNSID